MVHFDTCIDRCCGERYIRQYSIGSHWFLINFPTYLNIGIASVPLICMLFLSFIFRTAFSTTNHNPLYFISFQDGSSNFQVFRFSNDFFFQILLFSFCFKTQVRTWLFDALFSRQLFDLSWKFASFFSLRFSVLYGCVSVRIDPPCLRVQISLFARSSLHILMGLLHVFFRDIHCTIVWIGVYMSANGESILVSIWL